MDIPDDCANMARPSFILERSCNLGAGVFRDISIVPSMRLLDITSAGQARGLVIMSSCLCSCICLA